MKNSGIKSPRRIRSGFDVVEGGDVAPKKRKQLKPQEDPKSHWDRAHLPVSTELTSRHFLIWISATDEDGHTTKPGASACAWRIRGEGADIKETWPGQTAESSEKKAYVAAVAGALDRLSQGSTAELICRDDYIVSAINGHLRTWEIKGELIPRPDEKYPRRPYGLVWAHVLRAINRIAPPKAIAARRPRIADDADDKIIEELKETARAQRPSRRK